MGALIACSIISGRALSPMGTLPMMLVQWAHARAALKGLEKVFALETDHHGMDSPLLPDAIHGAYEFRDVKFFYSRFEAALRVDQLQIRAGEKIGIVGPVGAGKSTLLKLASGLYKPQFGRVLIDGLDISGVGRGVLAEHVGYLPQEARLFSGSLRENLLIGIADPGDAAIIAACKSTGLIDLVASHPKGLELPVPEGGQAVSGGQRQLIGITRLMLAQPGVWLMDEPTSSMDTAAERRCITLLREAMQPEHTVLMVTHKESMLPLIDRLIVVARGTIVLDGPRDLVMQRLIQGESAQPLIRSAA
jgi:ATP-binding cassette subfamily C protein LapB